MITDEMVLMAFKTWWKLGWDFGDEDGDENDEDTMKAKDAQLAMRAALEAVAPMIIRDAMAECALELRAKGCHDIAKVFEAYADAIEKVLAKEPQ